MRGKKRPHLSGCYGSGQGACVSVVHGVWRVRRHLRQQNLRDWRMTTTIDYRRQTVAPSCSHKLMQFHKIARHTSTTPTPSNSTGEFPSGFPTISIIHSNCDCAARRCGSRAFCHRDWQSAVCTRTATALRKGRVIYHAEYARTPILSETLALYKSFTYLLAYLHHFSNPKQTWKVES